MFKKIHDKKKLFLFLLLGILKNTMIYADTFTLMLPLYNEMVEERCKEYAYCLETNLANAAIKQVHILYDTFRDKKENSLFLGYLKELQHKSVKPIFITPIERRQTFKDFFDLA